MTKLNEFLKECRQSESVLHEKGEAIVDELMRNFLKENPKVKGLAIKAGIPSYNDGDPCKLTLYGVYLSLKEIDPEEPEANLIDKYDCEDAELKEKVNDLEDCFPYDVNMLSYLVDEGITVYTRNSKYKIDWYPEY